MAMIYDSVWRLGLAEADREAFDDWLNEHGIEPELFQDMHVKTRVSLLDPTPVSGCAVSVLIEGTQQVREFDNRPKLVEAQ